MFANPLRSFDFVLVLSILLSHGTRTHVSGLSTIAKSPSTSTKSESPTKTQSSERNVNFVDWISDAPDEIRNWKQLPLHDNTTPDLEQQQQFIPPYVKGTLIRNGSGIWTSETESYSHMFDGLAKIHAYRINADESENKATVEYQARFLEGMWYKDYLAREGKTLPLALGTGPVLDSSTENPKLGWWRTAQALWNSATKFDNTPVNIWDFQPHRQDQSKAITAITDAAPRTEFNLESIDTISTSTINKFASGSTGFELLCTAHPLYSQRESESLDGVDTYNIGVELGLNGPRINLIKETATSTADGIRRRSVVASVASDDGIPYFHSFGLSKNYAVVIVQPLRLDLQPAKLMELGFLRAMEHVDQSRVIVFDLNTGKTVMDQYIDEKVYFYHSISTAEIIGDTTDDDITVSLRLCAYDVPDQLTGEHQFLRLEQATKGLEWRSKIHKGGRFCDINCNLKDDSVSVEWNTAITQGFELPITRYSRSFVGQEKGAPTSKSTDGKPRDQPHPRYVYSFGAYAFGSSDYDDWGLYKFDMHQNKIAASYKEDSVYVSEPAFVADPEGENEDDGVLLTHAYFGKEEETKLLVLDARSLDVLATVPTGFRSPLEFHGAWIPSSK